MASSDSEMAVLADYKSSLNDLDCNSKPMINVLTMLAEENQSFAKGIVKIIRERILESTMKIKLPSLYLLDSILKNVGGDFIEIISLNMIDIFTNVFEKGDEKIRVSLFKLRNTWPQYFPTAFLHQLDLVVRELDPNWPVVEIPPSSGSIHINPKFLIEEHNSSGMSENKSARDSLHLKAHKEQLLAEEQRIQDQLRKLKAEQQRIVASKEEEERISREWFLKQKQLEREQMIREQQKQIMVLRKIQEEQETSHHKRMERTGKITEKPQSMVKSKQSDPRLPKEESKHEKLRTEKSETKTENIESIEDVNISEKNQRRVTVMNEDCSIEKSEEEPVAKKRKSNDELQELSKNEQKLSSCSEISKETGKGKNEIIDSITDLPFQKDDISLPDSEKVKVEEATWSSGNEHDPNVKDRGVISEVIHDKTQHNSLKETNGSKRLQDLAAVVKSENNPVLEHAAHCLDGTYKVSSTATGVTKLSREPVGLVVKNDGNILSSGVDSESDAIQKALVTIENDETSEIMDVPFRNGKRKHKVGACEEKNKEREAKGGYNSTKAFTQKLEHQAVDKKDITSRAVTSRAVTSRDVASRDVASRAVTSRAVASRDVASRDVASRDVASRAVTSRDITSRDVASRDVASRAVASRDVASRDVASRDVASRDVASRDITSRDVASRDVASRAVASRDVASRDVACRDVASRDVASRDVASRDVTSRDAPTQKTNIQEMRGGMPMPLPRSIEDRDDRPEFLRNEKQIPSRQRHPRGRGALIRGRGNRRTPPLDSALLSTPNEHLPDKRLKRPPWRRPMEQQPDMRRPSRPYRGMENEDENKRLPRENRRIDFYPGRPRFKGRLSGSSATNPKRMGRHGYGNERQEPRETFGAPQRSENRHNDDYMYRNQHFEEPRNFQADESDFYDPRSNPMERRERLQFPERGIGEFEPEARIFNRGYNRMQFHNENDLPPVHEEDSRPRNSIRFPPNERFLRNDEDYRPYDERNIPQDPEYVNDRFIMRSGEFSRRNHNYMPRYVEDEDRFVKAYRGSTEKQFKDRLPPDNLEPVVNQREEQNPYDFDRFTGKRESAFLQAGDSGGDREGFGNRIDDESTTRSTNSSSLMEMIMNIKQGSESLSNKEEPPADADSTQPQRQEASTGIKKLFEGLLSAGVLQGSMFNNEPAPSPPPNIETSEDDIPSIGFVMEQLKTRHDSVINKLYSGAQCGTCGLRFTQDDKKFYRDHLDWHFRNNRIGRDGKRSASRAWYHFKEAWMDMDDVTDFEEQAKSAVFELEKTLQNPVASENNPSCSVLRGDEVCNICFEPFEQFWDESLEEWRYNDAIRIDGMAYHVNCYDDVKTGHNSDQEVSADEMGTGLSGDLFSKNNENLSSTPIELDDKPYLIGQLNILPSNVDKQELPEVSLNTNLQNQHIESTENSKEDTPEPSKELFSKLADDLKGKDDNEVT